jgi:CRISPR-associated endonuclease Csn1
MKQSASQKTKSTLSRLAERPINEDIVFGIDVGIASCGWAVVDVKNETILAMGSRCFEAPEDPQKKTLNNAGRRTKRGMRRVTSRRAGRMNSVRQVIKEAGLVESPTHEYFQSLGSNAPDPWEIRALAVEEAVTPEEAAIALIHIAKHRGFKSNSKRDAADSEGKVVLSAIKEQDKKLDGRTYGKAIYDDHGNGRKRNREGDYQFTPSRDHTCQEAKKIIAKQRQRGAEWATEEFEERYLAKAFHQRPLQSSEELVGDCPFEPGEKRTARFSYSYEKFRLLQTLINRCKVSTPNGERDLTERELKLAVSNFGTRKGLTYTRLRGSIDLPDNHRFVGAPNPEDEGKDVTGVSTGATEGSYVLFKTLGSDDWNHLTKTPRVLDSIAAIITFNESTDEIRKRLDELPLEPDTIDSLMENLEANKFNRFKGTGNISAKAARKIIPELLRGKTYDIACDEVGYDHTKGLDTSIQDIKNPVVQRALAQAIKQVEVLVRCYGRPYKIHVELMREVGKSANERGEMERGIKKRTAERDQHRQDFLSTVGLQSCSRDDLQIYELLKEQNFRCPYCDKYMRPDEIVNSNVQIDHIYPRSRSHEDAFVNKVATCIRCNQSKRDRTPWEWRGESDPEWWNLFIAQVKGFTCKTEKKRRLQSKGFKDRECAFIERNKVDNSYTSRALLRELRRLYPASYDGGAIVPGSHRHIFSRPGQLTAMLRYAWLGKRYKKDRDDDRHHAMDALIVALVDEGLLQQLTRAYQGLELSARQHKTTPNIAPPWEAFAQDALAAYDAGWLVCRTENRRSRGALHEETIRHSRIDEDGKQIFYERKSIDAITKSDIARIPDSVIKERVGKWVDAGKPKDEDQRPKSAKGDPIRKLRLPTKIKTATQINSEYMGGKDPRRQGGFAENSSMVRVDLFKVNESKRDANGRRFTSGYYLVPVYLWQVAAKDSKTPLKAIVGGKSEDEWPQMDPKDFVMSLYKDNYVEIEKPDGELIGGYYRDADRSGGTIAISRHNRRHIKEKIRGIGVKTLAGIHKFQVDRLGIKHEIPAGSERWPGYQHDR